MAELDPWETAAPAAPAEKLDPWEKPAAAAAEPKSEDWGTLALSALGEGAAEAAGFVGDIVKPVGVGIGQLGRRALGKKPLSEEELQQLYANDPVEAVRSHVDSDALKGYEKKVGGFNEFYKPRTELGDWAYEGARLLPGAVGGPAALGRLALKEGVKVAGKQLFWNGVRYAAAPAVAGKGAEKLAENIPWAKDYAPWVKAGVEAATGLGAGLHAKPYARAPVKERIEVPPLPPRTEYMPGQDLSPYQLEQMKQRAAGVEAAMAREKQAAAASATSAASRTAKTSIIENAVEEARQHADWHRNPGRVLADRFRRIARDQETMAQFNPVERKAINQLANPSRAQRFAHVLAGIHKPLRREAGLGGIGALLLSLGSVGEGAASAAGLLQHVVEHASDMALPLGLGVAGLHVARGVPASVGRATARRRADILANLVASGRQPTRRRFGVAGKQVPDLPQAFPGVAPAVAMPYLTDQEDQP